VRGFSLFVVKREKRNSGKFGAEKGERRVREKEKKSHVLREWTKGTHGNGASF